MDNKNFSKKDLDFLLFEHLEGNLAADISNELIRKSTIDYSIEEELDSWKGAYIDQEYYNTAVLEEKLYCIPSDINKNVRTNTYFFTLTILIVVLNFVPLSFKNHTSEISDNRGKLESIITYAPDEAELLNLAPLKSEKAVDNSEAAAEIMPMAPAEENIKKKSVYYEVKPLEPLQVVETIDLTNASPKIDFIKKPISKTSADQSVKRPTISRQTQRAIEKSKEKDLQDRRAMEFIRGNKPYVVPLNSNF